MRLQRLSSVAIWRTRAAVAYREVYQLRNALPKAALAAMDHQLDMQGFLTSCALTGALCLAACGSPAGLDEEAFPALDQTGYGGTTQVVSGGQGGSSGAALSAGAAVGANGGGAQASAGSGSNGGNGSNGGSGTTGGSMTMGSSGCPSDATTLFARPIAQGGCTSGQGGGCHEAGSQKPDLVSPNVAMRLLNVASTCKKTSSGMTVPARPYIGATDSFLEEKIAGTPDQSCGISMPFFMPDALSPADEQCIIQWIDQVAGG
jgi:hypothetical protein